MTVYFVQENSPAKRIKIGFTDGDPLVRIRNLRTANAFPLTLLVAIPGTAKDEAALHVRFNDLRRHLEWFEPHPRLLGFIEALRMKFPEQPVDDGEEVEPEELIYGFTREQREFMIEMVMGLLFRFDVKRATSRLSRSDDARGYLSVHEGIYPDVIGFYTGVLYGQSADTPEEIEKYGREELHDILLNLDKPQLAAADVEATDQSESAPQEVH